MEREGERREREKRGRMREMGYSGPCSLLPKEDGQRNREKKERKRKETKEKTKQKMRKKLEQVKQIF